MEIKTKWELEKLFGYKSINDKKIFKDLEKQEKEIEKFAKKREKKEIKNAETMKQMLDELSKLNLNPIFGKSRYYSYLKYQLENNEENQKLFNKILNQSLEIENKLTFVKYKILNLSDKKLKKFIKSKELKNYKHYLEQIYKLKQYNFDEKTEKIENLYYPVTYQKWKDLVGKALSNETKKLKIDDKEIEVTLPELRSKRSNDKNPEIRGEANKLLKEIFDKNEYLTVSSLNAVLNKYQIYDKIHNFPKPYSHRCLIDDIDEKTVETMTKTVTNNFKISHKFYELKIKILKNLGIIEKDKLYYYERNLLPEIKENEKIEFEKGIEIINNILVEIYPEFSHYLQNLLKNGQIDVFPKKGKRGGAFSISMNKNLPNFIFLNYTGKLQDLNTISHELGHNLHSRYSQQKQNGLNYEYPISIAETASTFLETFFMEKYLNEYIKADKKSKLFIKLHRANDMISAIQRQVAGFNMELELHQQFRKEGGLSADEINKIFVKNMKSYLGNKFIFEGNENFWIHRPHLRYGFYVYSYAMGNLLALILLEKFKQDKSFIVEIINKFLSQGSSKSPEEIFKSLSIDLSNKKTRLTGLKFIENLLDEIESDAKELDLI